MAVGTIQVIYMVVGMTDAMEMPVRTMGAVEVVAGPIKEIGMPAGPMGQWRLWISPQVRCRP